MPEGPEIHRAADRLAAALVGQTLSDVYLRFERLRPWLPHIQGQKVVSVRARGKAMLVGFSSGVTLYSHNQLYGKWMVRKAGSLPKTNRELRVGLYAPKKWALLYSASDIFVVDNSDLDALPYLKKLGPDLLDDATTESVVLARLADPKVARRGLGGMLLDQGFLAGTGNYLRSEILFDARVHPRTRAGALSDEARRTLARSALTITRRSYKTGGLTADAELVKKLKAKRWPRRRYRHYVFDREGQECHVCGTRIVKTAIAGRRLYLCPTCQPG